MRLNRRALLASLAAAPLAGLARPALADAALADYEAALDQALAEAGVPAMTAGVVSREGLIWSGVRGVRRAGGDAVAGPDDLWHLGSNGKAMTALLYGRLVEQGRARWEAPLSALFEGVTVDPALASVTVDDLLRHRSGLLDRDLMGRDVLMAAHQDPRPAHEQRAELAAVVLAKPPTGEVGAFAYGNLNYTLAGAAIERLTGQPWEAVIQSELFGPLGITTAGHGAPQGENPWGHRTVGAALIPVDPAGIADNPAVFGPAGRIHMSTADYARFLRVWLDRGGGLVSAETIARLTATPVGSPPPYAYGWGVRPDAALGPVLAHEGSNTLWHAIAQVAPERGLAVFAIANERTKGGPADQALSQRLMSLAAG